MAYFSTGKYIWNKTDTHWTNYSAYLSTIDLLNELNIDDSYISAGTFTDTESIPGDLANMLNLGGYIDTGYRTVFLMENPYRAEQTENEFWKHVRYTNFRGKGKLLMARDSFCSEMMPYIAEVFQECDFVHHRIFSFDMIDKYEPDVFVYEIIERSIDDTLPEFAELVN